MTSKTKTSQNVDFGRFKAGRGQPLFAICGPCVIESRDHVMKIAGFLTELSKKLSVPIIFKSSYDKANRTSAGSYRGLGIDAGLKILEEVRREFGLPIVTDVHTEEEAAQAGQSVDLLQIPAFLCRQTSLLEAAGKTAKPVMIKKGQFLAPEDMQFAIEKVNAAGSSQVICCERGACFGYRELVVDMRGLEVMRALGAPVVFDATHSVQRMGGAGGKSSGSREYVAPLARAAVALGVDGVFLECHDRPDSAPSDGPNMLPLEAVEPLLRDLKVLHELKLETRN